HLRSSDHSAGLAFREERFLQLQQISMFAAGGANELLQRKFEFSPARKPSTVDSVADTIHIATPDPLEAEQNIALQLGPNFFQVIGKPNYGFRAQALDGSEWPLLVRPVIRSDELHLVASCDDPMRKPFQIGLCAAGRRIPAANQNYPQVRRHTTWRYRTGESLPFPPSQPQTTNDQLLMTKEIRMTNNDGGIPSS